MALKEEFEIQGNWLFKRRSYLPVIAVCLFPFVISQYSPEVKELTHQLWSIFCFLISLFGLGVRILTIGFVPKGTSGRNIKRQVAETVNTTGMYSIVRHPLYLGNYIIVLGIVLFTMVWWFTLLISLLFWVYYERIMFAEEEFIRNKFGEPFEKWALHTPAFIPAINKWRSPELTFSLKSVIRREFPGLFSIIVLFSFIELLYEYISKGKVYFSVGWILFLISGLIFYIVILIVKKKTKLLHAAGR